MTQLNILFALVLAAFSSACAVPSDPPPPAQVTPRTYHSGGVQNVLIFAGASAWMPEVDSLASILYNHAVSYTEVDSAQLDAMSLDEIVAFNLIIFPGGDAPSMTNSLRAETHAKLRSAVQEKGMSYLGFCAGAWIAVAPAPEPGKDVTYGLGIVDRPLEDLNYLAKQGSHFALSMASFPDGTKRNLLWYGGPITPDISGGVLAKYPDGTPAITQIHSGKGFVIVSGLHPAANTFILNALALHDNNAIAPDYAWRLLDSAIHQIPMTSF